MSESTYERLPLREGEKAAAIATITNEGVTPIRLADVVIESGESLKVRTGFALNKNGRLVVVSAEEL